jgi:hypothetical protein
MSDDAHDKDARTTAQLSPSEFSTFVISLGSSVLVNLGDDEMSGVPGQAPDLELAKQSIAILVMLEEKTRGNLTEAEQQLVTGVIYQSRMAYVAIKQGASDSPE